MKKFLLALVAAVGLVFAGSGCVDLIKKSEFKTITYTNEAGSTLLTMQIPVDMPNFFIEPYAVDNMIPVNQNFILVAFRNGESDQDCFVLGIVALKDGTLHVVNFLDGRTDQFYMYPELDGTPVAATEEEITKQLEEWDLKTRGSYINETLNKRLEELFK